MFKHLELKIPPVILVIICSVLIWQTRALITYSGYSHFFLYSSYFLLFLSIIFPLSGVYYFRKAKTTVDPRNPSQASSLVTNGIYKFSRNPMYVGFFFFLLSLTFYLKTLIGFAWSFLFIIYMNRFQIIPEERELKKHFSKDYEKYLKNVSRWVLIKF